MPPLDDAGTPPPFDPSKPFETIAAPAAAPAAPPPFDPAKPFETVAAAPQWTAKSPFVVDPKTVTPEAFEAWKEQNPGAYAKMPDGRVLRTPMPVPEEAAKQEAAKYDTSGMEDTTPSEVGVVGRGMVRGVVPAATGMMGMGAGAAAGAALGAPLAPFTAGLSVPIGAIGGGIAGALGGGYAGQVAQDKVLDQMPGVQKALGQDPETRQADIEAHPYWALTGELLPSAVTMRPGIGVPRTGASALEQIMARGQIPSRAAGAGLMGATDAGLQMYEQGTIDPRKIDPARLAIVTGFGLAFNHPTNWVGRPLMRAGEWPVRAGVSGAFPDTAATIWGTPSPGPGGAPGGAPGGGPSGPRPGMPGGPPADPAAPSRGDIFGLPGEGSEIDPVAVKDVKDGYVFYVDADEREGGMTLAEFVSKARPMPKPEGPAGLPAPPETIDATATEVPPAAESAPAAPRAEPFDLAPESPAEPPVGSPENAGLSDLYPEAPADRPRPPGIPSAASPSPDGTWRAQRRDGAWVAWGPDGQLIGEIAAEPPQAAQPKPPASTEEADATLRADVTEGRPAVTDPVQERLEADRAEMGEPSAEKPLVPRGTEAPTETPPAEPRQPVDVQGPDYVREQLARDWELGQRLGVTEDVERLSAEGKTANEIAAELSDKLAVVRNLAKQNGENERGAVAQFVRNIRNGLGIPSQDQATEFAQWRDGYRQRQGAAEPPVESVPESAPAEPVAETPPPHEEAVRNAEASPFDEVDRRDARRMLSVYGDDKNVQETVRRIAQGERWQDLYLELKTPMTAFETRGLAEITPRSEPVAPPTVARPEASASNTEESQLHPNAPTVSDEKHSKTGKDLFYVRFPQKPDIDGLGARARQMGGKWSSYNKDGARPGWQFSKRESADRFADWATKQMGEAPAEPVQKPVEGGDKTTADAPRGTAEAEPITPNGVEEGYVPSGMDPDLYRMRQELARASAETEPPSAAEKESGNYKKGRFNFHGLQFVIETPVGEYREGTGPEGDWAVKMPVDYGYISKTLGADGDHVDAYMGQDLLSQTAWVIDQVHADSGKFDEHKLMLGFSNWRDARDAYLDAFSDGKGEDRLGKVTPMSLDELKTWLKEGDTKNPIGQKSLSFDGNAPTSTETPADTMGGGRPREAENGVQEPVPPRDAGPRPEDDAGPGETRPAEAAPRPEDQGGARDAGRDVEPTPAPEPRAGEGGGGDRAVDADRVPAGGRTGEFDTEGAAGRPAEGETAPEVKAPTLKGRDLDLEEAQALQNPTAQPGREVEFIRGTNYVIEPGALQEGRGPALKARDNVAAIKMAKALTEEGRAATREEQEALAKYVGWGGLKGAFPDPATGQFAKGFEQIGAELKRILTPAEYRTAIRSVQYAHYTSEPVIRAMWDAVGRLGFKGGRVFEPGMGVGHFLGMMPTDAAKASKYQGLEMDHLSAMISKLLYPESGVRQADFTRTPLPKDAFDLAIGNPPFGDIVITSDPKYAAQKLRIHDYFIAKSLDSVRPGGLLAMITSTGTMDKLDSAPREYLASRAELVGAVRVPGGAFSKNAGTEVTTDILFFKKHPFGPQDLGDRPPPWTETVQATLPNAKGVPHTDNVSRYFIDNPDQVLGELGFFDRLYQNRIAVRLREGEDLSTLMRDAFERLPENVMEPPPDPRQLAALDFSAAEKKDGSFYLSPTGQLMQYLDGAGRAVLPRGKGVEGGRTAAEIQTIRSLLPIRDAMREVYRHDLAENIEEAARARATLNRVYDAFVAKNGPLNKAEITTRRPNRVQMENARNEAREEARELGQTWDEGSFDPTEMIAAKATTAQIAAARTEARERAIERGQAWDEGSFDPEDMPSIVIDKRPNIDPFSDDQESYRLRALENYNEVTGEASKRRVFFENILSREQEPELKSAQDGILWSVNKFGRLDIDQIAEKLGQPRDKVIDDLGDAVMRLPGTEDQFAPKDAYLSGDVVTKLEEARAAAARDPRFQANVAALEKAQPAPIGPGEIAVNLGMPWLPVQTIRDFIDHLGIGRARVEYHPLMGQWKVDTANAAYGDNQAAWSTNKVAAHELLDDALNRRPTVVRTPRDAEGKTYVDQEATQAAQDMTKRMKETFTDWVLADPERADMLTGLYNAKFNRVVLRQWNGDYLTTPGVSKEWSWRPHQTRVVARGIQDGNLYMAHAVGAGKTSAMIGIGMEQRRLGLINKPMYVVPNHMLGQFAKEFYEQYPTARIKVADERNFHTSRRKQFVADVSQQDLDAVIITNSAFKKVGVSRDFEDGLIREQIDELDAAIAELSGADNRITRSDLQKRKERLEQRLARGTGDKDQVFTFEELGADFLFVDEAHQFRKLSFVTTNPMKGITSQGSDMAWDLYTKVRYLDQNRPGRSIVMASGTPVTNTMGELYTLQRYMQPQALKDAGLSHFDSWSMAHGEVNTELEPTAQGTYENATRFSKFVNMPELYRMVGQVMDVVTEGELGQYVVRPAVAGGERELHIAPRTGWLDEYQQTLKQRADAIKARRGPPSKGDDIILALIGDGRKGAIDPRMIDPRLPNDPSSKLNQMIAAVHQVWRDTADTQFYDPNTEYKKKAFKGPATQMVFANSKLGSEVNGQRFSAYQWMKREWTRLGIPADHIAFIEDAKTPVAKQRLFNDVNEGKVRILVGSVAKMGTGVNAQRRLAAIHNLDPLWYPADDTQRNGRGIRQGNYNPEIQIHDYSTLGTYDEQMWKMMGRKGRFIEQFFRGDPNLREMEDIGEAGVYEQISGMTATDPRVLQLANLKQTLATMERRQRAHENEQYSYRQRAQSEAQSAAWYRGEGDQASEALSRAKDISGNKFQMTVGDKKYTDRKAAGEAIEKAFKEADGYLRKGQEAIVGEIGGFPLIAWGQERMAADNSKYVEARPYLKLWDGKTNASMPDLSWTGSGVGLIQSASIYIKDLSAARDSYYQSASQAETRAASNKAQIGKEFADRDKVQPLRRQVAELEAALSAKPEAPAEAEGAAVDDPSTLSRLMSDESGAGWNPFARTRYADKVERDAIDEAIGPPNIPKGPGWSSHFYSVFGMGPTSPGKNKHFFNVVNKYTTAASNAARYDIGGVSAQKERAGREMREDAARWRNTYAEMLETYRTATPEENQKLMAFLELQRLQGVQTPLDGRTPVARNAAAYDDTTPMAYQPMARHSRPGEVLALDTDRLKAMYGEIRRTMDQGWKDYIKTFAESRGWDGPATSAAIREAAERADNRPAEKKRLEQLAKMVEALEYAQRTAYVPFMRFGDYFFHVLPKENAPEWLQGEGKRPTVWFSLMDPRNFVDKMLGGARDGGGALKDYRDELVKRFPADQYEIREGHWNPTENELRSIGIPTIEKLFSIIGNDSEKLWREKAKTAEVVEHPSGTGFAIKFADGEFARAESRGRTPGEILRWNDRSDANVRSAAMDAYKRQEQAIESLLDQIYEEMQAGFKKRARNTPGYDQDLTRSIATYINWVASNLSHMKHRDAIDAANLAVDNSYDPRTKQYWRDNDAFMERERDGIVDNVTRGARNAAYYWYLGMNAASTMKNMLDGPMVHMPALWGGLGAENIPRAAAAYLGAEKDALKTFHVGRYGLDVRAMDAAKTPAERALVRDAELSDLLRPKAAQEMGAMTREGADALTPDKDLRRRAFEILQSNMSATDRLQRVAMLLGAFRYAQTVGMDKINRLWIKGDRSWAAEPDKSPENWAKFMVRRVVPGGGEANLAPMMRNPIGAMIGQFQTYALNYLSTVYQLMTRMGAAGKAAGAMMLGGAFMLGGVTILPFVTLAMKAAEAVYNFFSSEDIDLKTELLRAAEAMGFNSHVGETILHGFSRNVLGIDLSSLAVTNFLDDMGRSGSAQPGLEALGPAAGLLSAGLKAKARSDHGESTAAVAAELLPSAVRNFVKGVFVYPEQGVRTLRGGKSAQVLSPEQMGTWEKGAAAVGFPSAKLARAYEQREMGRRAGELAKQPTAELNKKLEGIAVRAAFARKVGNTTLANQLDAQFQAAIKSAPPGAKPNMPAITAAVGQALNPQIGGLKQAPRAARPGILNSPYVQP